MLAVEEALRLAADACLHRSHPDEREDVRDVGKLVYQALGSPRPLELPRELRAPILRSLHERPELRYGTLAELRQALGIAEPAPVPPRASRVAPFVAGLLAALSVGAVGRVSPRPPAKSPMRSAAAAAVAAPPPRLVKVVRFAAPEDQAWVGAGVADMLATVLDARSGVKIDDAAVASIEGSVLEEGGGLVIEARLIERGATLFAERVPVPAPAGLIAAADGLGTRLAGALHAGSGPQLSRLATANVDAYRAFIEGNPERALALDPRFDRARARLELAARLKAERASGKYAECAADAERLGATEDLVACRLGAGDIDGARAAAHGVLVGDVAVMVGDWQAARAAYAGDRARLALLSYRTTGRCKAALRLASIDDARIAHFLARACGDWEQAAAAEAWLKTRDPALADSLAVARAAARGDRGAFARARGLAGDRAAHLAPLLRAARAEGHAAEALAEYAPATADRWGLFDDPVLLEAALAQADVGDVESARLACDELISIPALYCRGRVAEAAGDAAAEFRAFRELLDRWSDADVDNRLVRDARRRLLKR